SVNDSSPKTNVPQFPDTERSSNRFPGPKLSSTVTVYTVPSISTCACPTPFRVNTSSSTTLCPPRFALEPPPGSVGGGELPAPLAELGERPGPDERPDPEDGGGPTRNSGGVENGSRPPNCATGGTIGVPPGDGVTVGVGLADRRGVPVGAPPPPLSTLNRIKPTTATPTMMPAIRSVRLSRSEIGMARSTPPRSARAPSRDRRSWR